MVKIKITKITIVDHRCQYDHHRRSSSSMSIMREKASMREHGSESQSGHVAACQRGEGKTPGQRTCDHGFCRRLLKAKYLAGKAEPYARLKLRPHTLGWKAPAQLAVTARLVYKVADHKAFCENG